jgi:hypothetical protein
MSLAGVCLVHSSSHPFKYPPHPVPAIMQGVNHKKTCLPQPQWHADQGKPYCSCHCLIEACSACSCIESNALARTNRGVFSLQLH